MRKLKLQMQLSVDGYVAGPNGELDWMSFDQDSNLLALINSLTDSSDTILLGRKMTDGFVNYWENVVNNQPDSPEFSFAQKMVDTPKVVFSKTLKSIAGKNVTIENGDLATAVKNMKSKTGKDIIVYGGADFVSSLIKEGLIDEFNFFINPIMINKGLRIFDLLGERQKLLLQNATGYECGVVVLSYQLTGG
ncbi:dihydrofolate reductase family protein [Spirosoma endbachense]|uniref:Dihydrofolate reductase n=1 Tax=Spirosoma endbachense TaxID=2666025 RepID=A0A6P1VRS3_9BACT|nr:dihydrofolate reductase family protein [Spirosoma endbachense]QHV94802.1 dihydrofolate reductase [Spirosoma endbachense]